MPPGVLDEFLEDSIELLWLFPIRGMSGTLDNLQFPAPECWHGQLADIGRVHALISLTMHYG
jgi:hypothetical protein